MGVAFDNWSSPHPPVILDDVRVVSANRTGSGYADFGWSSEENIVAAHSAFVVSAIASDPYGETGWIEFRNCVSEAGFYFHSSDPTKKINAIILP
jgi:hypothetical protein